MISFKHRQFQKDFILMSIRWYLAYSLSYRDIEELMLARGVRVDHATINRWVIKYAPELEQEFSAKHKLPGGSSWRADETYIKVKGIWHYYYRAVDKEGNTLDFYLSEKRDKKAAVAFFTKTIGSNGLPDKVTVDESGSNKTALDYLNAYLFVIEFFSFLIGIAPRFLNFTIRQIKYLNNIVEQDHRFIKKITKPILGFKTFHSAKATLSGIELHRMLRKCQHKNSGVNNLFEQFYALAS